MLESTESLLPKPKSGEPDQKLKVVCLGSDAYPLDELKRLLDTLGVVVVGELSAQIRKINPATYLPQGKLEAAKVLAQHKGADAIIVDLELSPNQLRNIEEFIGFPTLDRPGVILEIFSQHARSKESKTQVELAKLQYVMPRLAHLWTHFERQQGGGAGNRGMGEKQIEVDRRLVKRRMQMLEKRLKEVEAERITQRAGRKAVLKVALVGYTNAGKSTLLNALTDSKVLAEDKLFATLDPSVRMLSPDSHPPVVAVDTVGFVSRLPHGLVASFRSTLEEVLEADLLVHVVDGSSPTAYEELKVTEEVLQEIGVEDRPKMVIVNKIDLIEKGPDGLLKKNQLRVIAPGALLVSALDLEEVKKLRTRILDHFKARLATFELLIPYADSRMEALIHEHGSVEIKRHMEKGTFLKVRMEEAWAKKLGILKYST